MAPRGIQEWYYTQDLPARAVGVAQVSTSAFSPEDLVDVSNTPFQPGTLGIWKSASNLSGPADFTAPDFNQAVAISGDSSYYIANQFYQLTNQSSNGIPLYYYHPLPAGVTGVTLLDLKGVVQAAPVIHVVGQFLYHDMGVGPFYVRYIDARGFLVQQLLQYNPVLTEAPYAPSATAFVRAGRSLQVNTTGTVYIRFTRANGYQALVPYNTLPNTPWFMRISYGLNPVAPEWARQLFLPQRPYILASWVPGKVLGANLIEFERKQMFLDPGHLPDVLVFDKTGQVKYAFDGTAPGSPRRRGTLYPWKRGQIKSGIDIFNARVETIVPLDLTDVVYGFYSYNEQDVVYTALDVNPFTNPVVKNTVVQFYFKSAVSDPFHNIFHQVVDQNGVPVPGQTNDGVNPNLILDSNGTGITWIGTGVTFSSSGGAVAGGSWTYTGTGVASGFQSSKSQILTVTPGKTYTISGYIDATKVTAGGPSWRVSDIAVSTTYAAVAQTLGVSGRVSTTVTIPAGVTQVRILLDTENCTVTAAQPVIWSDPKLELGSTLTAYEPDTTTRTIFATVIVGGSVGVGRFTVDDVRQDGGGLEPQWQTLPESAHFWDLGYWDGKPYPAGGGLIVHLPSSVLGELSKTDIQNKIEALLPMGVIPVIFYYDPVTGEESR